MIIISVFGDRLIELRKDKNIKQKDLATILNVSHDMLSAYERGLTQMPDDVKVVVAKYFSVSLDYLFGLINQEVNYKRSEKLCFPNCFDKEATEKAKDYIRLLELEIKSKK